MRADRLECVDDFVCADGLPRPDREQDIVHRHNTRDGPSEALDGKTADVVLFHRGERRMHVIVGLTGKHLLLGHLTNRDL